MELKYFSGKQFSQRQISSNRTFMELKLNMQGIKVLEITSSNRTFMELKFRG